MPLDQEHQEELERLTRYFDPSRWTGNREELETSFGDLQNRVQDKQRADLKSFVEGYDAKELRSRTADRVQSLTERINTGRDSEQMFAAQEAINQLKRGAMSEMQADGAYQEERSSEQAERANLQAEDMKIIYDREGELLQAHGFTKSPEQQIASSLDRIASMQRERDDERER